MIECNRSRAPLLAALSVAMLLAHADAQPPSGESTAMPPSKEGASPARAVVEGEDARLEATFGFDGAKQRLSVRYRIENTGDTPLAVFDRGNAHAVLTKRQKAGAVGAPLMEQDGGDVTLSHVALPLPTPAPTVPPTPLAVKLDAGTSLDGAFDFNLSLADTPKRLRWCVGVASFTEDEFTASKQAGEVQVWSASFAVIESQRTLCTPWYDPAGGTFEAGSTHP
jgi:hypothetical protein